MVDVYMRWKRRGNRGRAVVLVQERAIRQPERTTNKNGRQEAGGRLKECCSLFCVNTLEPIKGIRPSMLPHCKVRRKSPIKAQDSDKTPIVNMAQCTHLYNFHRQNSHAMKEERFLYITRMHEFVLANVYRHAPDQEPLSVISRYRPFARKTAIVYCCRPKPKQRLRSRLNNLFVQTSMLVGASIRKVAPLHKVSNPFGKVPTGLGNRVRSSGSLVALQPLALSRSSLEVGCDRSGIAASSNHRASHLIPICVKRSL